MTGVSLFQSLHLPRTSTTSSGVFNLNFLPSIFPSPSSSESTWRYSKIETLPISGRQAFESWDSQNFTHLLTSQPNCLIFKLNSEEGSSPRSEERQIYRKMRVGDEVVGPSLEFGGVEIKRLGEVLGDVKGLVRELMGRDVESDGEELKTEKDEGEGEARVERVKHRIKRLWPIEIVWKESVWICERKQDV